MVGGLQPLVFVTVFSHDQRTTPVSANGMSSRGNRHPARRATVGIGALEVYSRPKACEESTVNRPIRMPLAWPMTSRLASADWRCSRAQLACSAAAPCEPSTAPIVPDSQSNAPGSVPKRLSIPAVRPPTVYSLTDGAADPPSPRRHGSTSAIGARPGSLVGTHDRRAVQGRLQSGAVTEPFPEDVGMVNMPRRCGVGFELAVLGDQ